MAGDKLHSCSKRHWLTSTKNAVYWLYYDNAPKYNKAISLLYKYTDIFVIGFK